MKEFQKLVDIIAQLRDPVSGCPWDVKQTPESLVPNFIEELYEAVEAIEEKDSNALLEELGDLLLHIVFQARIAEEEGRLGCQGHDARAVARDLCDIKDRVISLHRLGISAKRGLGKANLLHQSYPACQGYVVLQAEPIGYQSIGIGLR